MPSSYHEENDRPELDVLAALAEHVVMRVPGCSEVMVRKTISEMFRDFCKRTCVLRTVRTVELEHGVCDYPVAPRHAGCMVDAVVDVSIGGRRVELDGYSFCGGDVVHLGERLLPAEGETREMRVECVEVPLIGSEHASRMFLERYGDAVVSGTLMRLLSMSDRPWSDAAQASVEARKYENELTEHRMRYHSGGNLSTGGGNFIKEGLII